MSTQASKTPMLFQNISESLLQKIHRNPSTAEGRESHYDQAIKILEPMCKALAPFDFDNMSEVTPEAWEKLKELGFKQNDKNPRSLTFEQEFWALVVIISNQTERAQLHFICAKHLFSNFVQDPFTVEVTKGDEIYNVSLPCVEVGFQAQKADLAGDDKAFEAIYYATEPKACKSLGNKVTGLDIDKWNLKSPEFMTELFKLKLKQSYGTRNVFIRLYGLAAIFNTPAENPVYIHEGADFCIVWGTGLNVKDTMEILACSAGMDEYPTFAPYIGMNRFGKCMDQAVKTACFAMPVMRQREQTEQPTKKARLSPTVEPTPSSPVHQDDERTESFCVRTMSSSTAQTEEPPSSTPVIDASVADANADVSVADADANDSFTGPESAE